MAGSIKDPLLYTKKRDFRNTVIGISGEKHNLEISIEKERK